jgi:hypothetical protein
LSPSISFKATCISSSLKYCDVSTLTAIIIPYSLSAFS